MAIFVNPNQHPLRFEIDQQWFEVGPNGGQCDIPDRKAFVVKNRGLSLVTPDEWLASRPAASAPPAPAPAPEPPPAPVEESPVPASPESPPAPQAKPRSARKPVDPPAVPDADKASPT